MSQDPVLLERDGAVAIVTLNRPDAYNSLDVATKIALRDTLAALAEEESVRAVVLTGSGRAFCVGQDLKEHAEALRTVGAAALDTVEEHYTPIVTALATMPKPVVAAVNGACVGAGLGFALACDLRVFSTAAKLGTAFTGIGLTFDSGLAASLARSVGEARARELILLGESFDAPTAVEWGIAGRLVEPAEVVTTARELAARLAAGPTRAYAESKKLVAESFGRPLAETLAEEGHAQSRLAGTEDHVNAVEAFVAKQKPVFQGR